MDYLKSTENIEQRSEVIEDLSVIICAGICASICAGVLALADYAIFPEHYLEHRKKDEVKNIAESEEDEKIDDELYQILLKELKLKELKKD